MRSVSPGSFRKLSFSPEAMTLAFPMVLSSERAFLLQAPVLIRSTEPSLLVRFRGIIANWREAPP